MSRDEDMGTTGLQLVCVDGLVEESNCDQNLDRVYQFRNQKITDDNGFKLSYQLVSDRQQDNQNMACAPKHLITWHNFSSVNDNVEKLLYPIESGDIYDRGLINEVDSQVHVFQGVLSKFNTCKIASDRGHHLTLPMPPEF